MVEFSKKWEKNKARSNREGKSKDTLRIITVVFVFFLNDEVTIFVFCEKSRIRENGREKKRSVSENDAMKDENLNI